MNQMLFTDTAGGLSTGSAGKCQHILIASDSFSRFGAALLFAAILAAPAIGQDNRVEILRDGLQDYAELAGIARACDAGQTDRIEEFAQRIAVLRFPSWWSGWNGDRSDYARMIASVARLRLDVGLMKGCDPLVGRTEAGLAREWEMTLDRELGR